MLEAPGTVKPLFDIYGLPTKNTVFDFDLGSTLASHLSGSVIMGFLRQLSERTCFLRGRVLAQHDNATG